MNINNQLELILENLAKSIDNQSFVVDKKDVSPNWERAIQTQTAFVTSDASGYKYSTVSYDLYPCYGLLNSGGMAAATLQYRLSDENHALLYDVMRKFYQNYSERFALPDNRYANICQGICVYKIHAAFLATQLTPVLTVFCKENRIAF